MLSISNRRQILWRQFGSLGEKARFFSLSFCSLLQLQVFPNYGDHGASLSMQGHGRGHVCSLLFLVMSLQPSMSPLDICVSISVSPEVLVCHCEEILHVTIRHPMFEIIITLNFEHWVKVRKKGRWDTREMALDIYGGLVWCWVWQKAGDTCEAGSLFYSALPSVAMCQLCSHSGVVGLFVSLSKSTSGYACWAWSKSWS